MDARTMAYIIIDQSVSARETRPGQPIYISHFLADGSIRIADHDGPISTAVFESGMSFARMNGWLQPSGSEHILTSVGYAQVADEDE